MGQGEDASFLQWWNLHPLRDGTRAVYLGHQVRICTLDSVDSHPRQEPAVVAAFAEIWGTEELLVSYGSCCRIMAC